MLEKSMRLNSSNKAQNLLYKLDTMRRRHADAAKSEKSEVPTASTAPSEPEKPKYTAAQVQLCKEILSKKNYYSILGVAQNAKEDDIKKAYKKLAIKLHPDKNHAPKATDAFKKVSVAYACLTDESKRRIYDQTGEEPGNHQSSSRASRFNHGRHEHEVDPEEIFRMFFGGGMFNHGHNSPYYQRRGQRQQQQQQYRHSQ